VEGCSLPLWLSFQKIFGLILNNLQIVGTDGKPASIHLEGNKIKDVRAVVEKSGDKGLIHFENAIAFPGLINSHDHLDFNVLPIFNRGKYENYIQWSEDFNRRYREKPHDFFQVSPSIRYRVGILKNLLAGVTTVVNHGIKIEISENCPIEVFQDCLSLHSVKFEPIWRYKINFVRRSQKVVMHMGEGTGDPMRHEIDQIIKWNLTGRGIIAVHGIAMTIKQAKKLQGLVWCPKSNLNLYNKTAEIHKLKSQITILFGTDSNFSAGWNLWDHLREAREMGFLSDEELFKICTENPALLWKLSFSGKIYPGYRADVVIAWKKSSSMWNAFYKVNPEDILMIIKDGKVILFDETIVKKIKKRISMSDYLKTTYEKQYKKYVTSYFSQLKSQPEVALDQLPIKIDEASNGSKA